jgi:hypothetical protein
LPPRPIGKAAAVTSTGNGVEGGEDIFRKRFGSN